MASKKQTRDRCRVWEIQSQCEHNGEAIWTEEIVKQFVDTLLEKRKDKNGNTTVRFAWCNHDKDDYIEESIRALKERDPDATAKVGDKRPAHIHLMLEFHDPIARDTLFKLVKEVSPNFDIYFIRKPNAPRHQFLAMITYLTHCRAGEQKKGKHLYKDNEVHHNLDDYREEVDRYLKLVGEADGEPPEKKKSQRAVAEEMIDQLEQGEITLEGAKEKSKDQFGFAFFLHHEKEFRLARAEFIKSKYVMKTRANYYIFGTSGSGKSTLSQRLAMALFPDLSEHECCYTVGSVGVRFDDYEGQPVILWEDARADQLLKEYGPEGILNLMELSPRKRAYNIKFGNVTLIHQVNIFTCTEPFEDFATALLTIKDAHGKVIKTEDIEQVRRRFPVVINICQDNHQLEIWRNIKLFDDGKKRSSFKKYAIVRNVNIGALLRKFSGAALDKAFGIIAAPFVNLHKEFMENFSGDTKLEDEIFAPENISVVEGYDNLEAEEQRPDYTTYIELCKKMMYAYQIDEPLTDETVDADSNTESETDDMFQPPAPSIERFGPYKAEHGWRLGDALSGDYAGAYCPFTYEQWCGMEKPIDLDYNGFVSEDSPEDKDEDQENSNPYRNEDLDLAEEYGEKEKHIAGRRQELVEYLKAKKTGEKAVLPEGLTEEDADYVNETLTEEELLYVDNDSPDDIKETEQTDKPWVGEYVNALRAAAQEFMATRSEETLKRWIGCLFEKLDYKGVHDNVTAWACVCECWYAIRAACIESGMARNATEWYGLYQRLNSECVQENEDEEADDGAQGKEEPQNLSDGKDEDSAQTDDDTADRCGQTGTNASTGDDSQANENQADEDAAQE